jgi:hypothetical protein
LLDALTRDWLALGLSASHACHRDDCGDRSDGDEGGRPEAPGHEPVIVIRRAGPVMFEPLVVIDDDGTSTPMSVRAASEAPSM